MKMRIVEYDTWGNAEDGYDVNNIYKTDMVYDIPEGASEDDIIKILKEVDVKHPAENLWDLTHNSNRYAPYLLPTAEVEVEIWNYPYIEIVVKETREPIGRLEPVDDDDGWY